MLTEVAFWACHEIIALEFFRMSVLALPPQSGSAAGHTATVMVGTSSTVSAAWSVVVPPGPVAVAVNDWEALATIESEPLGATLPIPLLIVTVVALVELQVRVADPPCGTLSGWMENASVGAAVDAV